MKLEEDVSNCMAVISNLRDRGCTFEMARHVIVQEMNLNDTQAMDFIQRIEEITGIQLER